MVIVVPKFVHFFSLFRLQLVDAHQSREQAIKRCIVKVSEAVHTLRTKRDQDEDNPRLIKELRKEQNKLRMMQNELNVEEVVRDRSIKVGVNKNRMQFFRLIIFGLFGFLRFSTNDVDPFIGHLNDSLLFQSQHNLNIISKSLLHALS